MIIIWAKSCASCIPAAARNKESSGLIHSWPITTPFAIISVNVWQPGSVVNADGMVDILNSMCDMTQFIVMASIQNLEASHIVGVFMENVLLKFGLCVMVVVDEGKAFCSIFKDMCRLLNIRCQTVSKRNYKAVGVERFH